MQSYFSGYHPLCTNCKQTHQSSSSCPPICIYCHQYHTRQKLVQNLCPLMYEFAQNQQKKHSFICKKCDGLGIFQKIVQVIYQQTQQNYQKKKRQALLVNQPSPQRKILKKTKQQKQQKCGDCLGKGIILRMLNCQCANGCIQCHYQSIKINPIWLKYRMEPIINRNQFFCVICHCQVQVSQQKFTIQCGHEFHSKCLFAWFKSSSTQNCPVCRGKDPYINTNQQIQNNILFENPSIDRRRRRQ